MIPSFSLTAAGLDYVRCQLPEKSFNKRFSNFVHCHTGILIPMALTPEAQCVEMRSWWVMVW